MIFYSYMYMMVLLSNKYINIIIIITKPGRKRLNNLNNILHSTTGISLLHAHVPTDGGVDVCNLLDILTINHLQVFVCFLWSFSSGTFTVQLVSPSYHLNTVREYKQCNLFTARL